MQENSMPPAGSRNVLMLVLSYLGILALVPLLTETEDAEVQRHAKLGLVLLGAELVLFTAMMVISHIPLLGFIIGCGLFPFIWLGITALHIAAIIKAVRGEMLRIPLLSEIADGWR